MAKALSGGFVASGAVLTTRAVHDAVYDRMERAPVHGSTFGGNDLAAAAGIATLRALEDAGRWWSRARTLGERLMERTRPLMDATGWSATCAGWWLMWAIELGEPEAAAGRAVRRAVERRQPGLARAAALGAALHRAPSSPRRRGAA